MSGRHNSTMMFVIESGWAHVNNSNIGSFQTAILKSLKFWNPGFSYLFSLSVGILDFEVGINQKNIFRLQVCMSESIIVHELDGPAKLQKFMKILNF